MDDDAAISQLGDFEVISERASIPQAIAALTDRYRRALIRALKHTQSLVP